MKQTILLFLLMILFINHQSKADVALNFCAMAHCNPRLSDQIFSQSITGFSQTWKFGSRGVGFGLGAVVGTDFTAITFSSSPSLVVLNADGTERWNSGNQIGSLTKSAALVDSFNNIYVADNNNIFKFSPFGVLIWRTPNPANSTPFSLNVTSEGNLFGYGQSGSAWLVNQASGLVLSTLNLTGRVGNKNGTYITVNTASISGNRIYIATQFSSNSKYGRLYALDSTNEVLNVAWTWDFGGVTGGSPTISGNRIYFDGRRINATDNSTGLFLFAVQDNGSSPQLLWFQNIASLSNSGNDIQVSPAIDTRGGVWAFAVNGSNLLRFNELNGQNIQQINLSNTLNGQYAPSSVMMIAHNNGFPLMYVGAMPKQGFSGLPKITAIDLNNGNLIFSHNLESNTYSQFPIIPSNPNVLIVPSASSGIYGLRGN